MTQQRVGWAARPTFVDGDWSVRCVEHANPPACTDGRSFVRSFFKAFVRRSRTRVRTRARTYPRLSGSIVEPLLTSSANPCMFSTPEMYPMSSPNNNAPSVENRAAMVTNLTNGRRGEDSYHVRYTIASNMSCCCCCCCSIVLHCTVFQATKINCRGAPILAVLCSVTVGQRDNRTVALQQRRQQRHVNSANLPVGKLRQLLLVLELGWLPSGSLGEQAVDTSITIIVVIDVTPISHLRSVAHRLVR